MLKTFLIYCIFLGVLTSSSVIYSDSSAPSSNQENVSQDEVLSVEFEISDVNALPNSEIHSLYQKGSSNEVNCSNVYDNKPSSGFPDDIFTDLQRDHGAVILHFIAAVYCFGMIGIVCGDYFLPSVDCICCDLKLSQDVAAATFMSFATSTPEFFTILIGTFITETDIGIGAVVGSGMFNVLGVATCGGLAASKSIKLDWWPLYRDSIIYVAVLTAFIVVIWDEMVTLGEALFLCVCYILYFVLMALNPKMRRIVKKCVKKCQRKKKSQPETISATVVPFPTISLSLTEEQTNFNNNIIRTTSFTSRTPEENDIEDNEMGQGSYTPYFIRYGESRRLSRKSTTSETSEKSRTGKKSIGGLSDGTIKSSLQVPWSDRLPEIYDQYEGNTANGTLPKNWSPSNGLTSTETKVVGRAENVNPPTAFDISEDEDDEKSQSFFHIPEGSVWESITWIVMLPASLLFFFTVPDCRKKRWRKFYPVTFLMCIFWIGVTSYFGTWMISVLGDTIGIPDSVMGLTFLAAGGSMPEAISTIIMAKQGQGGIGFSNSLGGNTMDICLCLAVPWLIKCAIDGIVRLESHGLQYNIMALFIGVFILLVVATVNKFNMNKKMGVACFLFYMVFIVMSILIEIGVIIDLPYLRCR